MWVNIPYIEHNMGIVFQTGYNSPTRLVGSLQLSFQLKWDKFQLIAFEVEKHYMVDTCFFKIHVDWGPWEYAWNMALKLQMGEDAVDLDGQGSTIFISTPFQSLKGSDLFLGGRWWYIPYTRESWIYAIIWYEITTLSWWGNEKMETWNIFPRLLMSSAWNWYLCAVYLAGGAINLPAGSSPCTMSRMSYRVGHSLWMLESFLMEMWGDVNEFLSVWCLMI